MQDWTTLTSKDVIEYRRQENAYFNFKTGELICWSSMDADRAQTFLSYMVGYARKMDLYSA